MASQELKAVRRAQGLCVYCGRPAVIKADGTPARRCKECSDSHVRQKRDARHGIETRGRVTGRSRGHVEQKYYQRPGQELVTCPDCGIRTNADYWYCPWCGCILGVPDEYHEETNKESLIPAGSR